jgi:hypothetical protein
MLVDFSLGFALCLLLVTLWDISRTTSAPLPSTRSVEDVIVVTVDHPFPVTVTPSATATIPSWAKTATAAPSPTRRPIVPTPTPTPPMRSDKPANGKDEIR